MKKYITIPTALGTEQIPATGIACINNDSSSNSIKIRYANGSMVELGGTPTNADLNLIANAVIEVNQSNWRKVVKELPELSIGSAATTFTFTF